MGQRIQAVLNAETMQRSQLMGMKKGANMYLKSPSFCSRSQAESPHIFCVLPLSDEFGERIAFCGSHEKFGKCLASRVCHDEFGGRDAGTNGSQPGPERIPNEAGEQRRQDIGAVPGLERQPERGLDKAWILRFI